MVYPIFLFGQVSNNDLLNRDNDLVKSDSVIYSIHKANIGKIAFMKDAIPIENFQQKDFLTAFELKDNIDLNIRVFLNNSLTNYLHRLSPQLTLDELTKNGNYQFSFYIDSVKVYAENLNAGAAESKNKKTVWRVPLISSSNEDSWGRFLWNRFMMKGGEEALTTGTHVLKIEIRPYMLLNEVVTGNVIAEGNVKIIIPEIKIDKNLITVQAINPVKDWRISAETFDRHKIEELNQKILTKVYKDLSSIIVIKNGKLLIEEYFNGANRNTLHDTRSVGKSFASCILGIAIKDQYIRHEFQTLKEFYDLKAFQNYSTSKDSITLKQLLIMSSPFTGSDRDETSPGNEENMYPSKNWVEFTLGLPIDHTKVITPRWDYFTAGVVVIGDVIHKSVPGGLEQYAHKTLFQPLGISHYKWQFTPQQVANTAGGLKLRSLDLAKFGQLYQNKGDWNGVQILTKDWVEKSLKKQVEIPDEGFYGYLFWNKTYGTNGKNYDVFYSSGNGGNKIFIFKDQPLVIIVTAQAYNKPYGHSQVDRIMTNYLIPALFN
jgi:CubicO group peptidase (beta-lactamase class C family)